MNYSKIKDALQDLIIRLQDAEKGYREISLATTNRSLKKWLNNYANERHTMHKSLESIVRSFGKDTEVRTSFLGDLHRMFIDIKLNNTNQDQEFDAVVTEINRGANRLVDDFNKVLSDIELPATITQTLLSQRTTVEIELQELNKLAEEFNSVAI